MYIYSHIFKSQILPPETLDCYPVHPNQKGVDCRTVYINTIPWVSFQKVIAQSRKYDHPLLVLTHKILVLPSVSPSFMRSGCPYPLSRIYHICWNATVGHFLQWQPFAF